MTQKPNSKRRGVVLPLIAVLTIFIMAMVVFFVDIAFMQLSRTQLQAATDAAAKAACEALDAGLTPDEVRQVAIDVAAANQVAGQPLTLELEDIELGQSVEQSDGSWEFQAGVTPFTAARVTGIKSDDKPSGSVPLFFAGTMGVDSFSPIQTAEASQFEHEVMLCVDRSHSMCFDFTGDDWSYPGPAGDPGIDEEGSTYCRRPHKVSSRWAALYNGVSSFLEIAESNGASMQQTVGLVTWASDYTSPCDASMDFPAARLESTMGYGYSSMDGILATLGNQTMNGGTNMSAGLDMAIMELTGVNANPAAKKTLILFTDGQWNTGDDPATRIPAAQAANITIHVISLLDNLDPAEMDAIAGATGGVHYRASTAQELLDAFQGLARSLPVVLTK